MASAKDLAGSETRSDHDLVMLIQAGDDDAATLLYDRYSTRLKLLADQQMSQGVRRVFEPEDIVQSAFRSLFRGVNAGSYCAPEGRSLWSLLAVIAINKVRRKATRDRSVVAVSLESASSDDQTSIDVPDSLSPEQFESSLREAIESLRPAEQEVVHCVFRDSVLKRSVIGFSEAAERSNGLFRAFGQSWPRQFRKNLKKSKNSWRGSFCNWPSGPCERLKIFGRTHASVFLAHLVDRSRP